MAEPKNKFPFKTKEPENFQCEIVETAGPSIRRTRLARKGNWRRLDYDLGEKQQKTILRTDKEYLIDPDRGIYAERSSPSGNTPGGNFAELTHELLTTGRRGEFEEIGREGNIVRYSVRLDGGEANEIIIHHDDLIGLPVKQEFFSVSTGGRSLEYSIEMINFKSEPDESLFIIPPGFRKVTPAEFHAN